MSNQVPGTPTSLIVAKAQARRLSTALSGQYPIKHGQALELVARLHGQESWGHLRAVIEAGNGSALPASPMAASPVDPHRDDDRVLLERTTLEGALRKIDRHRRLLDGAGLDQRLRAELARILGDIAKEGPKTPSVYTGPDLSYGASAYLERVTLGAVRAAEARALDAGTIKPWKYGFPLSVLLAMVLPEDPASIPPPTSGGRTISPDRIEDRFRHLAPYRLGFDRVPRDLLFDGLHGLVLGRDLEVLKQWPHSIIELIDPARNDLRDLAEAWGLTTPEAGFASGTDGLRWLMDQRMKQMGAGDAEMRHGSVRERQIVALRLSDMIASGGADVLLAQARSFGLHLLVWVDSPDIRENDFERVAPNVASLIILGGATVALVRSERLHETQGGRLKIARPFERLSLGDRVRNSMVRLRR